MPRLQFCCLEQFPSARLAFWLCNKSWKKKKRNLSIAFSSHQFMDVLILLFLPSDSCFKTSFAVMMLSTELQSEFPPNLHGQKCLKNSWHQSCRSWLRVYFKKYFHPKIFTMGGLFQKLHFFVTGKLIFLRLVAKLLFLLYTNLWRQYFYWSLQPLEKNGLAKSFEAQTQPDQAKG